MLAFVGVELVERGQVETEGLVVGPRSSGVDEEVVGRDGGVRRRMSGGLRRWAGWCRLRSGAGG